MRGLDPKYEEEVSGCTASVGLISKDKIYVVRRRIPYLRFRCADSSRATLETPDQFSASKVEQNRCLLTTSRRMKV